MTNLEFDALPKSVQGAMLWAKQEQEDYEETDISKLVRSIGDIDKGPEEPLFVRGDEEADYRRGFDHGIVYAVQLIESLKQKGFIRPQEIANIISRWEYEVVYHWRSKAHADVQKDDYSLCCGHPFLEQESWFDIRRRIIKRDGGKCVHCGGQEKLHVHHLDPVNEGGIPTDDNLETVCKGCHTEL